MGVDLRVVVETHSEYLVNRLGALISKQRISSEDASVLVFEKNSFSEATDIRHSFFSDKGYLKNWPHGFFEPVQE
jgi:predicted ATPase